MLSAKVMTRWRSQGAEWKLSTSFLLVVAVSSSSQDFLHLEISETGTQATAFSDCHGRRTLVLHLQDSPTHPYTSSPRLPPWGSLLGPPRPRVSRWPAMSLLHPSLALSPHFDRDCPGWSAFFACQLRSSVLGMSSATRKCYSALSIAIRGRSGASLASIAFYTSAKCSERLVSLVNYAATKLMLASTSCCLLPQTLGVLVIA